MSKYKYDFFQSHPSGILTDTVDLVDDMGWEESELDGMSREDLLDILYDDSRNWFRTQSRYGWSKIDG
jgi:hypothetical protein